MPLTFSAQQHGSLLYVTVSGTPDVAAAKRAYDVLLAQSAQSGVTGLLADCRGVEESPGDLERYQIATSIAQLNGELMRHGGSPPRIALVATPPVFDPSMFLETVAVNRGVELRAFTTMREAADWLQIDDATRSALPS